MITRALDKNNDIFVSNSRLAVNRDAEEVLQHTRTRLLFYLEEWFLDTTAGVPYLQEIFVKPLNLARLENIIRTEILNTEGTDSILNFSIDFDRETRKATIKYRANTVYGEVSDTLSINT